MEKEKESKLESSTRIVYTTADNTSSSLGQLGQRVSDLEEDMKELQVQANSNSQPDPNMRVIQARLQAITHAFNMLTVRDVNNYVTPAPIPAPQSSPFPSRSSLSRPEQMNVSQPSESRATKQQVLAILSDTPQSALTITRQISVNMRKAEVNRHLYDLLRAGQAAKQDGRPPLWTRLR